MPTEAFVDIFPNTIDDIKVLKNVSVVSHKLKSSNISANNSSYFVLGKNKLYNYVKTSNIIQVSCGTGRTLFLENTGKVLACGWNDNGSLGIGNYVSQSLPVYVKNSFNTNVLENIVQVSCGITHSLFLEYGGKVLSCGANDTGQLGIGDYTDRILPVYIKNINNTDYLDNIIQIKAGYYNSIFLENNGNVLICGDNLHGQLGIGVWHTDLFSCNLPVYVRNTTNAAKLSNIVFVESGLNLPYDSDLIYYLENTGQVLACGWNDTGVLGIGNIDSQNLPVYVRNTDNTANLSNIVQIAAGQGTCTFLEDTGQVLATGNDGGYLNFSINNLPAYIKKDNFSNLSDIIQISGKQDFHLFLESTGQVLGVGLNTAGTLGIGNYTSQSFPVYVRNNENTANLSSIVQISSGLHSMFLENTGKVITCGDNSYGQLGISNYTNRTLPINVNINTNNTTLYQGQKSYIEYPLASYNTIANRHIIQVSCGAWCTFFLENTGKVLVSGENYKKTLGIAENIDLVIFPKYVRNSDNTGFLNNIVSITTSPVASFFFENSGQLLACGKNTTGELGLGNYNITIYPQYVRNPENNGNLSNIIQVATAWNYYDVVNLTSHTLFLENTNRVLACGINNRGQLGIGDYNDKNLPVYVKNPDNNGELSNITQISAGGWFSMFVNSSNRVLSCGDNNYGQLGLGKQNTDLNNSNLPSYVRNVDNNGLLENITKISSGVLNTLFLQNTGCVFACGGNYLGQLGIGNYDYQTLPVYVRNYNNTDNISNIVEVLSGYWDDSFLLENTGKVFAFGENYSGELGIALNSQGITLPRYVKNVDGITDLTNIVKIHTGTDNTVFINDKNKILITGSYQNGEFDMYNPTYIYTPKYINIFDIDTDNINLFSSYLDTTLIINSSKNVVCNGYNYNNMFGNLSINKFIIDAYSEGVLNNIASIAVGSSHCLCLKDNLQVYVCGNNTYGQLGTGDFKKYFKPVALATNDIFITKIACGAYHSLFASHRKCFACGLNNYGQLGLGNNNNYNVITEITTPQLTFKSIQCGEYHSVFLNTENTVYSCGLNNYGQLGIGNTINQSIPTQIVSANLYGEVTKIACSKNNTIFLSKTHKVWISGNNNKYQLVNKYMQYSMDPIKITFYENVLDIYSNAFIDKIFVKYVV